MVVDNGATDNYVDPDLTPGCEPTCATSKNFGSRTIVAADQNLLQGIATGTICGTVTDDSGNDRLISFRVIVVPGLGTNLFSTDRGDAEGGGDVVSTDQPQIGERRRGCPDAATGGGRHDRQGHVLHQGEAWGWSWGPDGPRRQP